MYILSFKSISENMLKKVPENFEKSKSRESNRPNSDNKIFVKNGTCVERYTEGYLCTKFERSILIYEAMATKNELELLFAVK